MKLRTLNYCFKQGIINIFKNRLMSLASIGTISSCLFVIGLFYTVAANVEYMMDEVENKIGIAVFFEEDITEDEIMSLQSQIENREEVSSIEYISPEDAWNNFKEEYFEGKEELLAGFEEDNPLVNSASFQIFIKDIDSQEALVDYINSLEGVRYIRQTEDITEIVRGFNSFVNYMSIILIIILIIVSVFLISNTVRLAISLRKTEINIMKYIGATDFFIRFPFFIEGALIGAIGSVIPLTIIYFSYDLVIEKINNQFAIIQELLVFMDVNQVFTRLVPVSIIIGVGIGIVGSLLTMHKHLKV